VSSVAWVRYYLAGPTGRVRLVREVWPSPPEDPEAGGWLFQDVVAEHVVDFQVTFCRDTAANPALGPQPPVLVCGLGAAEGDDDVIREFSHQLRSATITVRVMTKGEDVAAFADPDAPTTWYDVDGNPDNGVARVRTMVRTVPLTSLAL
jgi:hypothetical protein